MMKKLLIALIIATPGIQTITQEFYLYPRTYIESIDTPSYGSQTEKVLRDFSALEDNKIISFVPNGYGRPIKIMEMDDSLFYTLIIPDAIGLAEPGAFNCKIYLKKGLSYGTFRETVIHEYLHCLGYQHVKDPGDIMYYSITHYNKEQNIKDYAKELRKRFYYDK